MADFGLLTRTDSRPMIHQSSKGIAIGTRTAMDVPPGSVRPRLQVPVVIATERNVKPVSTVGSE